MNKDGATGLPAANCPISVPLKNGMPSDCNSSTKTLLLDPTWQNVPSFWQGKSPLANISENRDYARQDSTDIFSVRIFDIALIDLGINHCSINALMPQ